MIPRHYFDVICCPACRGDLAELGGTGESRLRCGSCGAEYPIVDGIPVLVVGSEDLVSRQIAAFYADAWRRNEAGALRAKTIHEDNTDLGQRYAGEGGRRFRDHFLRRGARNRYLLDAACGAQPQRLGHPFTYHVCVDFSLAGLAECRRLLGDRAIVASGSLLKLPIRTGVCDGVVAAHCVYHIDKDRQAEALGELSRVLAPGGSMLVFYANPAAAPSPILKTGPLFWYRWLMQRELARAAPEPAPVLSQPIYSYLHPIDYMMKALSVGDGTRVSVRPVRLFTQDESRPALRSRFRKPFFWFFTLLEKVFRNRPGLAYYVAYVVEK
jgi:uncharacterized protein YbaR (Trm112 family)/SAM-dependent methyltransferase